MDEPGDVTEIRRCRDQRVDVLSRGGVDGRDAHVVPCVGQHLGCGFGVLPPKVGQKYVLPDPDPAGDGLADLARPMTTTTSLMLSPLAC